MVYGKYGWALGFGDIGVVFNFEMSTFEDVNEYERIKSSGYIWLDTLEGGINDIVLETIPKFHLFGIYDIFGRYVEITCENDNMEYN